MRPSARRHTYKPNKETDLSIIKKRLGLIFFVFAILHLSLAFNIIKNVALTSQEPQTNVKDYFTKPERRGNIYDINGDLLATSIKVNSLYADPKMMLNINDAVRSLKQLFPEIEVKELIEKLQNKHKRFVWIKRNLSPRQAYAVNSLGIPGIAFKQESFRIYPNGNLAAHVLGFTNRNGIGVSGIEKAFETELANGQDIYLTINSVLQNSLREKLMQQMVNTQASSAWAIAMNAKDGSVLASVSLPDYNANFANKAVAEQWKDRIQADVFEMGSITKAFTYALGFKEGLINLNSILDASKPIKIGRHKISDFHGKNKWLSVTDAFKYSSNIAASRIADEFTVEAQKQFFADLHLLERLDTDLTISADPIIPHEKNWKRLKKMTLSYGYGLAITPIQTVAALNSIGNGGVYVTPKFNKDTPTKEKRVISKETSANMRRLFSAVVEEGTGRRANIDGYLIGGKTGTAEILSETGDYKDKQNLATFVGFAPLDEPEIVVLVGINSPKGDTRGGGSAAAPVFKSFVQHAFAVLNIRPTVHKMQDKGFGILTTNKGE